MRRAPVSEKIAKLRKEADELQYGTFPRQWLEVSAKSVTPETDLYARPVDATIEWETEWYSGRLTYKLSVRAFNFSAPGMAEHALLDPRLPVEAIEKLAEVRRLLDAWIRGGPWPRAKRVDEKWTVVAE